MPAAPRGSRGQDDTHWSWEPASLVAHQRRFLFLQVALAAQLVFLGGVFFFLSSFGGSAAPAGNVSGAIFTTLPDGSVVNGNIYAAKCDVALNGGPASPNSHHLPAGLYHVAVTDPS